MISRRIFDLLTENVFGEIADRIHYYTGRFLPIWLCFVISITWDGIDIYTRLLTFVTALFVPVVGDFVGSILDIALVFLGAMLWGRTGLLQSVEFFSDFVPIIGPLTDFLPTLTIAGIICMRKQGKLESFNFSSTERGTQGGSMVTGAVLGAFSGFLGGGILWLSGYIDLPSVLLVILVCLVFGMLLMVFRSLRIPQGFWALLCIVDALVLLAGIGGYIYFTYGTSADDYRDVAWQAVVEEKGPQITMARKLDELRDSFDIDIKAGAEKAKEVAKSTRETIAEKMEKHDFEVPVLNAASRWLAQIVRPAEPSAEKKAEDSVEEELQKAQQEVSIEQHKEDVKRFGGPRQAKLYRSDFVLERANYVRNEKINLMESVCFWSGITLIFLLLLTFSGRSGRGQYTSNPSDDELFNSMWRR